MRLPVRITGVGGYLPPRTLTNHELAQMVDTTDDWIFSRTGIRERHIAGPEETSSTMGIAAARAALASADVDAADVDMIVVGTSTPDGMFPATATRIQHGIGATHAGAFDVNAACAGFLHALSVGAQYVASGSAQRVLVIGSETMSRILDWTDRGTCVLFGDGAGAVLLESAAPGELGGIDALLLRSDGSQAGSLYADGPCTPALAGARAEAHIVMDGQAVFRSAVTGLANAAADAIAEAGLTIDDIALCIPHQANVRIIQAVAKSLSLPMDRVFVNLDRTGNTSSASIPLALAEACATGRLQPGDRILFAAFGGGLSWGAAVLLWSGVRVARSTDRVSARVAGATTSA
ncbi:MAG: beta-ketoacyl-ACP synthase III [Dehalococcoidia bacterium]